MNGYEYTLELAPGLSGFVPDAWIVDWGDGSVDAVAGTHRYASHKYDDGPASLQVTTLAVVGGATIPVSTPITVEVANAALVISFSSTTVSGLSLDLQFVIEDPSATDQTAGFDVVVDWGDGTVDTFSTNDDSSEPLIGIAVKHTYADNGDYQVSLIATDRDGDDSQTLATTISIVKPLLVVSTIVNGGSMQRSNVEVIEVVFNQLINFEQLSANGDLFLAFETFGSEGGVPLTSERFRHDPTRFAVSIDLTIDGWGGSLSTLLANGSYELLLHTELITAHDDPARRLVDDDGNPDGTFRSSFHRLWGAFDGDRDVDLHDRNAFFAKFGSVDGDARYEFAFDLNGDGVIAIQDYFALLSLLGQSLD